MEANVIGTTAEKPVHLLAVESLFLEQERLCLAEFQGRAQERLRALEVAPA